MCMSARAAWCVRRGVQARSEVNAVDCDGRTALHHCVRTHPSPEARAVVKELCSWRADANLRDRCVPLLAVCSPLLMWCLWCDSFGNTSLHTALLNLEERGGLSDGKCALLRLSGDVVRAGGICVLCLLCLLCLCTPRANCALVAVRRRARQACAHATAVAREPSHSQQQTQETARYVHAATIPLARAV